jgi:hypothetical protein
MEYTGLIQKYPINRPLSDEERQHQLHQGERLDLVTSSQLCVVRMNSTFAEVVDTFFEWKGFLSTVILVCVLMSTTLIVAMLWISFTTQDRLAEDWPYLLVMGVVVAAFQCVAVWLLLFECFRFTHYPMRFNRKTRMVHVFRVDGSTFSVPWDKVFFCIARRYQPRWWSIQGHVLADDGVTVLETFSLPEVGSSPAGRERLKHFWEYLRRYMEEGPAQLSDPIKAVLPIAEARETFMFGIHRMMSMHSLVGFALMLPMYVAMYPGRWLAMRTSKIPQWPQRIDEECRTEPGDPYVREASMNPT